MDTFATWISLRSKETNKSEQHFFLLQWIREMVIFALDNKIENGVFLFFLHECRTKKKFSGPLRFVYVHDAFD